jgi:hypothetical protein
MLVGRARVGSAIRLTDRNHASEIGISGKGKGGSKSKKGSKGKGGSKSKKASKGKGKGGSSKSKKGSKGKGKGGGSSKSTGTFHVPIGQFCACWIGDSSHMP